MSDWKALSGYPYRTMNQNEMIQGLRAEIAKLQRVLDLLLEQPSTPEVRGPGRPKGSTNRATSFNPKEFAPKRRTMSAEGKARIAAAQKKRWAAQKGSAKTIAPAKKNASKAFASKAGSSKLAGKVAPATAKKSTGAGKRTGSAQGTSAKTLVKDVQKKTGAKKTIRAESMRPAKQAAGAGPEVQATA